MSEDLFCKESILYKTAMELFEEKNYGGAFEYFEKLGLKYECGYCKLMSANLYDAESIWESSKIDSPAVKWGLALIQLINENIPSKLSFFQIRNFLERDLSLLIENKHFQYAQNVIEARDLLMEYNPETAKFIGRVLLNNGYVEQSLEFLKLAKSVCYTDPEVHYLLAQYYVANNDKRTAISVLRDSLKVSPDYFPNATMLKNLCEQL